MNIRPLKDRVVVKRSKSKEPNGLIILPDIAKEPLNVGEVISIGSKVDGVKPGDTVYFGPYCDFERDGLVLIQEADIRLVEDHA